MSSRRVRAIVLNFERPEMTEKCVESVLRQDYPNLDIVVVDNCSGDGSYDRLRRVLPAGVHVVRTQKNNGYAAGNNAGARFEGLPKPDYFFILNNDILLPDSSTCRRLVEVLRSSQRGVAASPLVDTVGQPVPPHAQLQVRRVPDFATVLLASSWWLRRLPRLRRRYESYTYHDVRPYPPDATVPCETVNGSCFLIDSAFYDEIGGFDEGTFLYQEELILGKQIQERRGEGYLLTSSTVSHAQGATTGHNGGGYRLKMARHMLDSELYYCRRYLKSSRWQLALLVGVRTVDMLTKTTYDQLSPILR